MITRQERKASVAAMAEAVIEEELREFGVTLKTSARELGGYIAEQADALADIAQDEDVTGVAYDRAVLAARDNVAMMGGLIALDNCLDLKQRLRGVVHGTLRMGIIVIMGMA